MTQNHDIVILGATPAGFAAGYYLAGKKLNVVLVDAPRQPVESPLADWVPKDFFKTAGLPKKLLADCRAVEFDTVSYHNARLDKAVGYNSRGAAGYFVKIDQLVKTLRTAATAAGMKIRVSTTLPAIRLEEDCVRLIGSTQVAAKLLIIAHSRPNDVLSDLAMPVRTVPHSSLVVAGLDIPLAAKGAGKAFNGSLHVVESPERSELGMFFVVDGTLHLRVISGSEAAGNRVAELTGMVTNLQKAGVLPPSLHLGKARGAVWHPPAGIALELETHVAKRCLLMGTAGGFAESITGQTLTPSIRSAMLAADVATAALKAKDVQDALMAFKSSWRKTLADYLRPPNTSLQLLLPLLFVNQKIVSKFTRALLYGETI